MADEVARLVAVLEANMSKFDKEMGQAKKIADRQFGAIEKKMRQTERRFATAFKGGPNIGALIGRYTAWTVIVATLTKAMAEASKTNDDAAKATAELNRAWNAWTEVAAIALSPVLEATGKLLTNIAGITKELTSGNARSAWRRFAEMTSVQITDPNDPRQSIARALGAQQPRTSGIPLASAGNIPDSIAVTPSKLGAHATNDEVSEAAKRAKEKADIEKQIAQDAFNTQQHFLELEAAAVAKAVEIETEIRQHYFDAQQAQWETEAAELADFHERSAKAWDDYYERLAESTETSGDVRLEAVRQFFSELATLSRSSNEELQAIGKASAIVIATIDGIQAVQKALAAYPPPYNFAVAAAVGAATAANVAEIAGMEQGGRVQAGTPYIVGEKRPELFVPDTAGRIIPRLPNIANLAQGSRTLTMSFTNQNSFAGAVDANSIRAYADQVGEVSARSAIKTIQRQFPNLIVKAQRDRL